MDDNEQYVNILNIFIQYFNRQNKTNYNLFFDIERFDETNDMIEELREHIVEFNESDETTQRIYNPSEVDPVKFEAVYVLTIDTSIKCYCTILIPIINFMIKYIKLDECQWDISLIKNDV